MSIIFIQIELNGRKAARSKVEKVFKEEKFCAMKIDNLGNYKNIMDIIATSIMARMKIVAFISI